jgi:hypothetical protein
MTLIINVDKIEKIYVHKVRQARMVRYVEYSPAKYCFFCLIKYEPSVDAYWYHSFDSRYQNREDFVDKNSDYYINDEVLYEYSIWEKPHLYIVMSHSENVSTHYETYEQMMLALDKMVEASKNNLMVIKD